VSSPDFTPIVLSINAIRPQRQCKPAWGHACRADRSLSGAKCQLPFLESKPWPRVANRFPQESRLLPERTQQLSQECQLLPQECKRFPPEFKPLPQRT
jgi:hypothetical protein